MTFAVGTNIARRTYNQDRSLAIQRDNRALFAVADGMGGQGGGTAAELAIENLAELINGDTPFSAGPLRTAIAGANRAIYDAAVITAHLRGMGSTLSALWRNEGTIHIGHIGDSRIYRLHNQYFQQITTDHTFVQELVTTGELTGEEARVHPRRHWLSRALGIEPHARIDIATVPYDEKDIWLLCSDGLTAAVSDEEIALTLLQCYDPSQICDTLVELALSHGGQDNITVIVVK